jgi:hypothetical protein
MPLFRKTTPSRSWSNANAAIALLRLPGTAATTMGTVPPARPANATIPAWDPQGYCWTHGWKVKLGHSSGTCSQRKEGHDATATRTSTKNGSNLNIWWTGPKP